MSSFYDQVKETLDDIGYFSLHGTLDPLTPWDALQHLEKADKAVVDLLLRARNAVSPQTLQENEILGEMTITADLLLVHIRLYRERIDRFAGPNSASLSRQADMQLGDLAPGDIVPAPGPQWPDARNREVDMVIDQLEQSLSLMQAGHLKESMEAAVDARILTTSLPSTVPILTMQLHEMQDRYWERSVLLRGFDFTPRKISLEQLPEWLLETNQAVDGPEIFRNFLWGKGLRYREFQKGDYFTEVMKKDKTILLARDAILAWAKSFCDTGEDTASQKPRIYLDNRPNRYLTGWIDFPNDMLGAATDGKIGTQKDMAYIGSYHGWATLKSVDCHSRKAIIKWEVYNLMGLRSATLILPNKESPGALQNVVQRWLWEDEVSW